MLNERQELILKELIKFSPEFLNSTYFIDQFHVSLRTIHSDLKKIKDYVDQKSIGTVEGVPSKGNRIILKNRNNLYLIDEKDKGFNKSERVQQICFILLNKRKGVSRLYLTDKLFISTSTLTNDLNEADIFLEKYNLTIIRNSHCGIQIQGTELNKRKCLLEIGDLSEEQKNHDIKLRQVVESISVNVLLKHKYHVSETIFQNLIIHIELAVKRMQLGFHVSEEEEVPEEFIEEYKVAKEIFDNLSKRYHFKVTSGEILNLAIYIKGKSDYTNSEYVSKDIDEFIIYALEEINEKFNIDFSQEFDLKVSLALHIIPLITRINYNIQNSNELLDHIRQSFPLAFDIAAYMCLLLQKKIDKKVDEGEIAFLAIYFNQYINKYNDVTGRQRVLIITSLKRSESVLLRQRFITWFPNEIAVLTLVNIYEMESINVEDYDVIFTTESNQFTDSIGAISINTYPNEHEYSKLKLALDGFKDISEILNLFSEERYMYGHFDKKEDVLKAITESSKNQVNGNVELLYEAVGLRENLGSSYFGNFIAMPHPINPISVETFVSVILLDEDIKWDSDGNRVRLVLLVAIEKNNAKVFQLWNYLSKLVQDPSFIKNLIQDPSFENFSKNLSQIIKEYI